MLQNIWTTLIERQDFFLDLLWEHFYISSIAIIIAILLGGTIGILISEWTITAKPSLAVINFLYTIPSISMLGFLIPLSGIGNLSAIIALTIYALLPMVRNTHTGLTNIDERIIEAARGMGSTNFQLLYKIKLPLAMPVIISGIKSMVIMTIALTGIASFIGAGGLGVAIYRGITTNNQALTMTGSLLIALLALLMDFILGMFEKKLKISSKQQNHYKTALKILSLLLILSLAVTSFYKSREKDSIHIATKPMTEEYIMGEMLSLLISQDTDLEVVITQGVGGGTANIQPALEKAEFDIYPEYTGTAWNMVLKHNDIYTENLFSNLKQEYKDNYNFEWLGMYGFNNSYGLAVSKELAEKHQLKTYTDLSKISTSLVFGAEYDFYDREDGYQALKDKYNFQFKNTSDLDIGLKYQAIAENKIDVMTIFTTDGQLNVANLVVLEDDMHFFPSYHCGNVIRSEVLDKYPDLRTVLSKLDNSINDQAMSKMNYAVEVEGKLPRDVAKAYLEELAILK